jgi:hypothetical protein
MSVGCQGREYDGRREFVHISVPGTIVGTAREGMGSGGQVSVLRSCRESLQRMLQTGVGATSRENKSIECRVCRRCCLLLAELFDTDDGTER